LPSPEMPFHSPVPRPLAEMESPQPDFQQPDSPELVSPQLERSDPASPKLELRSSLLPKSAKPLCQQRVSPPQASLMLMLVPVSLQPM